MKVRLGVICLLCLALWSCGPPEMVPMTPPGVVYQRVVTDESEALGEARSKGNLAEPTQRPGRPKPPAGVSSAKDMLSAPVTKDRFSTPN